VLFAAVAGLALVPGAAGTASGAQQRCIYRIVYEGTFYNDTHAESVVPGARVGRAVRPGCNALSALRVYHWDSACKPCAAAQTPRPSA
jgi:hypothetical protein